ncbi:MAG: alpha/beta fold hydrolase [Rhodocyclales bacterium]|nr:alpha/beta fold hydrolase [Rhodocyclales bacterium]
MILYLHGFRSSPQSAKAQALAAYMAAKGFADSFYCPQLPVAPAEAMVMLRKEVARLAEHTGRLPTVVGSSLGGFYATRLAEDLGMRAVAVNPVVFPSRGLSAYVGRLTNLYTGEAFEWTPEHVAQLRALERDHLEHPERLWLMVELGDELLDHRQTIAFYQGAKQTVLEGGDHSFTRWNDYLDEILVWAGLMPAENAETN